MSGSNNLSNDNNSNVTSAKEETGNGNTAVQQLQATPMERLVIGILEGLEGCFATQTSSDSLEQHKATAMSLSSKLLTIPTQTTVDHCNKSLLSMLFPTRSAFFNPKVRICVITMQFKQHRNLCYDHAV